MANNILFIAAHYNSETDCIEVISEYGSTIIIPAAWFEVNGSGVKPDFSSVSVIDNGQTLALGQYEVANSSILADFDKEVHEPLSREFDELVGRMRTKDARSAARALFTDAPEKFGEAALAAIKDT